MENKELKDNIRQYLALKDQLDLITKRQTEIKQRLIEVVDAVEADDRGHRVLSVEDETVGEVTLTRQRRVSKSLNMDVAEEILTKKGIKDTCIKMVPIIDEGAIMAAFYENYLTEEDIDLMSTKRVNAGFGENGSDVYDIFRFKGGARCSHKWQRVTMMLDLNKMENGYEEIGTRAAEIKGFKVTNPYEVSIYPKNLPLKGFSPRNKNLPSDVK
jgi:hypothetical protein